tara:strand:+ start:90 stop:359 length:270 start_codon:yes stop_codon:yes gene_type:complete
MAKTSYIKTIEDENLHPYFLTMDDYCYTVYQDLSKNLDKSYTKKLGHFTSFEYAIERIATHKTNASDYNSIKEYIATYKEIKESLKIKL